MVHRPRSNRTEQDGSVTAAVSSARTQEPSIVGAVEAADASAPSIREAAEVAGRASDPPSRPVGGPADPSFIDKVGTVMRAVLPSVAAASPFVPGRPTEDTPGPAETAEAAGEVIRGIPGAAEDVARFGADALKNAPGRLAEFATRFASTSFLAPFAGLEEKILGPPTTEPGDPELAPEETVEVGDVEILKRPFQELVAAGQDAQGDVRQYFGNEENSLVNLTADLSAGIKQGNALFRSTSWIPKFMTKRFSSALFRPLVQGQRAQAALARLPGPARRVFTDPEAAGAMASRVGRVSLAGVEGNLFMEGLPETSEQEVQFGTIGAVALQGLSEVGGAAMSRYLRGKAQRTFTDVADDVDRILQEGGDTQIENFPTFLARQQTNLLRSAPLRQTSDEAIASTRAALSDAGETGTVGVVRGMTDLGEASVEDLQRAYPSYRFELLGGPQVREAGTEFPRAPSRPRNVPADPLDDQKLLFGLDPEADLPDGTTDAPRLTDEVVDEFRETNLLRGQKVLVQGREHRFVSGAPEGNRVLVEPMGRPGNPFPVPKNRVAPLDAHGGLLRNDRLVDQFRQFTSAQNFEDERLAFEEFWGRFLEDDFSNALKDPLRRYIDEQRTAQALARMNPEERATVQRFQDALRRFQQVGEEPQNLENMAAMRGFGVRRKSDERVLLTDMRTGRTPDVFRNEGRAREYLREFEYEEADLSAGIPGVPDDLIGGTLQPVARPNPSIPSKAELEERTVMERITGRAKDFGRVWSRHVTRQIRSMEDAARVMEEKGAIDQEIWAPAMQPLSRDLRVVQNRMRPFAEELSEIVGGRSEAEQDLIEGWLRSERKSVFETAHEMSDELVETAQRTRFWLDEVFNEWSASTGLTLSPDEYLRNYAPSNVDWNAETGGMWFDEFWNQQNTSTSIDELNEFFGEMWKSGDAREMAQEPLASKLSRMLRSGMFKAHAGDNFERAVTYAREALEDGSVAQRHLAQYLSGARGRTDFVRNRMDEVFGEMYSALGINVDEGRVTNLIDAGISQSYGGLIGFRPALLARQLYQPLNLGGPILGNSTVVRAQTDAHKPVHREWARRVGILEEREAVTFFEGLEADPTRNSIFRLNQQARSLGLKPYSGFDKHNRVALGLATKRNLEPELRRFRSGEINETELLENSGLWILDQPQRNKFFRVLDGDTRGTIGASSDERAVNFAADEIGSKLTNFLYGRHNAPMWMQSTFGRLLGAYSTWPRGYLNYITNLTSADVRPGVKAAAMAKHGMNNLAVASAGQATGLNLANWMPWNSLFFGGSPGFDQAVLMLKAWGGAPWERGQAAQQAGEQAVRSFVPAGQALAGDILPAVLAMDEFGPKQAAGAAGFATPQDADDRMRLIGGPFGFGMRANVVPEGVGLNEAPQGAELETPFGDIGEP